MLLPIISSLAVIVLTHWLLLTAWMSASPRAYLYNIFAVVAVVLWAQPWNSRDPYRTSHPMVRMITYLLLLVGMVANGYIFNRSGAFMVAVAVLILGGIELLGVQTIKQYGRHERPEALRHE